MDNPGYAKTICIRNNLLTNYIYRKLKDLALKHKAENKYKQRKHN